MADIDFNCPHCGQNLNGPEEMAGESIDCPICKKNFQIPGGLIEVPKTKMAPPSAPPAPESAPEAPAPAASETPPADASEAAPTAPDAPAPARAASDDEKGKTVRIDLPPEFLAEPDKHIFKIKRIQH